ncbi:MAG: hypothetical protein IKZ13_06795 [Akkermansia sp.]|nr:hypothetical protein [Akkermansia sp.]
MDEPFADIKGNTYHWSEIPGTRGEELYHEVEIGCGIEGKGESLVVVPNSQVNLKRGGQWQALEFQHANTRHFKYGCTPQDIDRSSRHLSIHALYALPAVPLLLALRYKVWACPIPGVEKDVDIGIRESKRYSIAR